MCPNYCPILVDIEDGRVTRVIGDKDNPLYRGYTCEKGRSLPRLLNHRERLLRSMRKTGADFEPVSPVGLDSRLDVGNPEMMADLHSAADNLSRTVDVHVEGSPTARLVDVEDHFERYSGQPRMSGVPMTVARYQRDQIANPYLGQRFRSGRLPDPDCGGDT